MSISILYARIIGSMLPFKEVFPLNKRYGPKFRVLHSCVDQTMTTALAQMGLTAAQGRILGFVSHSPQPPCPHDIEAAFQLSHPTVSGLLNRLEKKEFIAMRPDPADRRCKRIYILPRGEACNQRMHEVMDATETQIVRDFSPEEQAAFSQLLDRAISNMGGSFRRPCHRKEED